MHSIEWNAAAKLEIKNTMIDIQRTIVEGGAKRDHERPGKCANCSRREDCPDRIDITQAESKMRTLSILMNLIEVNTWPSNRDIYCEGIVDILRYPQVFRYRYLAHLQ